MNMRTSAPDVIRFDGLLQREAGEVLILLPMAVQSRLVSLKKVEGTINGHPFRAPLVHEAGKARALKVSAPMLRGGKVREGDVAQFAVLGPEPPLQIPRDLAEKFATYPVALTHWQTLSELGQRDWIRWIESAKQVETRQRRVRRAIEQLNEGKRRACCVNVNSFMLCRIAEDEYERQQRSIAV